MKEEYGLIDALLQRNRLEIIKKLSDGKRRYVSELADELGLSRATTVYHLDILRDAGIVEQEYEILVEPKSKKGKVGSFYRLDMDKLNEVVNKIKEMLPS